MDNNKSELSNRTTAFFSWLDFLGLALIMISATVLKQYDWLRLLALICLFSSFIYKTVTDWRAGRHRVVRNRLIIFALIIIIAIVVGISIGSK